SQKAQTCTSPSARNQSLDGRGQAMSLRAIEEVVFSPAWARRFYGSQLILTRSLPGSSAATAEAPKRVLPNPRVLPTVKVPEPAIAVGADKAKTRNQTMRDNRSASSVGPDFAGRPFRCQSPRLFQTNAEPPRSLSPIPHLPVPSTVSRRNSQRCFPN